MMHSKSIIVASAALFLLNACSSDSGTTGGTAPSVNTVSGVSVVLDGLYSRGCVVTGASSSYTSETTFAGQTLSNASAEYSDATCTVETGSGVLTGTFAASEAIAITGWDVTAPMASDNSGLLSDTEAVTTLNWTITSATGFYTTTAGTVIPRFFVVDDTGSKKIVYEDSDYAGRYGPVSTVAIDVPSTEQ